MIRMPQARRLVLVAIAGVIGAGAPALAVVAPSGPAPLEKGWGRVVASGTLSAVDRLRGRVQFAVTGTGTVDWFEGGSVWRRTPLTGTRTVRLLVATTLLDATAHALPLAAVQPGSAAMMWGVARPDAEMAGITLEVASAPAPAAAALAQSAIVPQTGVVVGLSGSTLVLLSTSARRTVVMTATTAVVAAGRQVAPTAIAPDDVVEVVGPMNSDGSIVAMRINVEFSAPDSARVSGPIEETLAALGGLVVDGTMISTSADTYIMRNGSAAALSEAAPGQLVLVYGIPVLDDATPVGLAARVVVFR